MSDIFKGWERHDLTWCRTEDGVRMEVSRTMNRESGLIEWHALAWTKERGDPLVSEYVGQDWHSAAALVLEANNPYKEG